jgi:hypothetical protein
MSTTIEHTLTAITDAIDAGPGSCLHCAAPLPDSPPEFCGEPCQKTWLTHHTGAASLPVGDGAVHPNQDIPETLPARPLAWLGPTPIDAVAGAGHEVLNAVSGFIGRYNVFPDEHCIPTLALWYAHTHLVHQFYITPRLVLDSAEPGSGKTRVLEVAALLVAHPEMTISATPAALFRLVAAGPITILFDEVDAIFNQKSDGNEDLRGLLNAGYKNGATVARCIGDAKQMKVQRFPVFAPAALAGIAGGMPDTITTRAITIHMRRRRANQTVEQFRHRTATRRAKPLRDALTTWTRTISGRIGDAIPEMPDGVTDRSAEIWEPLLAIADEAGDHWPTTARTACAHFVLNNGPQVRSTGIRLLADLRTVFRRHNTDRLATITVLGELHAMDESPWADLGGKPLDPRRLAKELGRYGVRAVPFKDSTNTTVKGYVTYPNDRQLGLTDAWDRYLTPDPTPGAVTAVTSVTTQVNPVTDDPPVTDPSVTAPPPAAEQPTTPPEPGNRSNGYHHTIGYQPDQRGYRGNRSNRTPGED